MTEPMTAEDLQPILAAHTVTAYASASDGICACTRFLLGAAKPLAERLRERGA